MLNLLAAEQEIYEFQKRYGDGDGPAGDSAPKQTFHAVLSKNFATAPDVDLVRLRSAQHLTWHRQQPMVDNSGLHEDGAQATDNLVSGACRPPPLWEAQHQDRQRHGGAVRLTTESHSHYLFDDRCEALATSTSASQSSSGTGPALPWLRRTLIPLDDPRAARQSASALGAPWRPQTDGSDDDDDDGDNGASEKLASDAYVAATLYDANPNVLQSRDGALEATRAVQHHTQEVLGHCAYGAVAISEAHRGPPGVDAASRHGGGDLLAHLRDASCGPTPAETSTPQWMSTESWHTMPSSDAGCGGSAVRGTVLEALHVLPRTPEEAREEAEAARQQRLSTFRNDVMDYRVPLTGARGPLSPATFSPFMRRRGRSGTP